MQNISSSSDLKEAIRLLEIEQTAKGQLLKEEFYHAYESLKPQNLFRSILKDFDLSPSLINTVLGTAAGMASGYLSKKVVVGFSGNVFRKLLGTIIQVGVTNSVAQHPNAIKSIGQFILQYVLKKKEMNSE